MIMVHWENRPEESWKEFRFGQPYAEGLSRLKVEVLGATDFDPATLWQWGTMQASAVIGVLKACERAFGEEGQRVVREALIEVGRDVGRQLLQDMKIPEGVSEAELVSFMVTAINRVVYASLEEPAIDSDREVSFHITWCPHQDYYTAFDCRVQRYLVQGIIEAMQEKGYMGDWQVRFDCTIPAGAPTCHFILWKATAEEKAEWERYTELLERKALQLSERG